MTRLSPEAQSIVDEANHSEKPALGEKNRIHAGLMAAIGSGTLVASTTTTAAASAGAASAIGVTSIGAVFVKAIAVVAVVGAVGATAVLQPWESSDATEARRAVAAPLDAEEIPSAVDESAMVREAEATSQGPEEAPVVAELVGAPAVPEADPGPPPTTRAASSVIPAEEQAESDHDSVTEDVALMQQAMAANRAHEYGAALALVNEHRAQHPNSALSLERAGLRVLLLCQLNRNQEAQTLGEQFLTRYGDSYLAMRIRQQCPSLN